MFNFETIDEMNAATDALAAFAPGLDERAVSQVVGAFYGAGFRILRLGEVSAPANPGAKGRPKKYDWTGMKLGDSRGYPDGPDMRNKLNGSVRQWAKVNAPGTRYSVVMRDGRLVVTRTA